jgi:ATP-binding cassette, subfamily B, bacterial
MIAEGRVGDPSYGRRTVVNRDSDGKYHGFFREACSILGCGRKVWHLIPPRPKVVFLIATALMVVVSVCNVAFSLLLGQLVNFASASEGTDRWVLLRGAAFILGLIAGAYLLRELVLLVQRYTVQAACTRVEQLFVVRVIGHLLRADLSKFADDKIGTLQGRISRSCVGSVRFLRLMFLDFLPPLATGILALLTALWKQPILAAVMAAMIPASVWLTMRQIASQKGVRLRLIRGRELIDGAVVELLGGIDYIRAAHTEDHELQRLERAAKDLRKLEKNHHFTMSLFGGLRSLNEGFFHICVLGMAVYLAVIGTISYGDILTFSMLFLSVMAPLNEVHRGLDEGHECSLMVADLIAMIEEPADRSYSPDLVEKPRVVTSEPLLVAEDLEVIYPTAAGPSTAISDISLSIRHGETIGFAGPSGCGKTTLLRVFLRLTHPTRGRVRVGGVPLENLSRADIGKLVGYVGQNPFVFHGTIEENIAYGIEHVATSAEIEEAARRAYLHDEIMAMPGGYQARVTERGANLSGGQRQRLALARVFLKDPAILILDEGTSALDTIGERRVKQAIDMARRDRTVILVAHRLSTLKDADRILVFQDGRIVERGTYEELSQRDGLFAELVRCADAPEEVAAT